MFLAFLSLLAFHSISIWPILSKKFHDYPQTETEFTTYNINRTGFHEIASVKSGDSIRVKFNGQPLRLFLFLSTNFEVVLQNLEIDGSNSNLKDHSEKVSYSNLKDLKENIAFAVDADDEAVFKFGSIERNHQNEEDKSHHNRFHFFKGKQRRTLKEKVKFITSKLAFHYQDYEKYDDEDFDFDFDHIKVALWLLPREMCGKSSIYEYGSNSNLTVGQAISIITSKTGDEITYSNCIFSPLFDIFDSKSSYDISIGINPSEFENSQNYKSSITAIYTNNLSKPDTVINGYEGYNHTFSNPFFSRYEIKQKIKEGENNSPLEVEVYMIKKVTQTDNFDYNRFDIFCSSGSVYFCNASSCFHDEMIEMKITQKCGDEIIWQILALIAGAAVVILIVLIVLICFCCVGCCACCGFLCCFGGINCRRRRENQETNSMSVSQHSRTPNGAEHDLELPLMSIDHGQADYHQPVPVYAPQPVYYVVPQNMSQLQIQQQQQMQQQQNAYQVPLQVQHI